MVYCFECGSEVAENDIFCPYCGISLPSSVIDGDKDDSQSNTIVIEQPENNFRETGSDAISAFQQSERIEAAEKFHSQTKLDETRTSEDKVKIEEESTNASVPEKIEILKPLGENLPVENQSTEATLNIEASQKTRENISTAKVETSVKGQPEIVSDIGEKEKSAETQNESSIMNYEEAKVKEGEEVYETELGGEENVDFTATIPYIPNIPKDLNSAAKKTAPNAEPNQSQTNGGEISSPQNESESESENLAPLAIAKPSEELEVAPIPPSKFDSVRIMEKRKPAKEQPEPLKPAPLPESSIKEQKISQPPEKAGRAFTTPNIGFGDTDGKKSSKLKPLDEGTVLNGRYEIIRKIGGGGMGAVYLASDRNLGGVLRAVKEMVQSYIEGEQQEKAVNDFKRESLLLTSLEHQSIPTIYDYFYDEKEARFYLVMKYISGGDLASRLRSAPEGRIEELSVTEWAIQVADVLDYLHNRQPPIVYRDLKPANIMIDGNSGRVMLIDFGIARWVNKEEKGVTAVGTMGYAPPELFSGNVEPRSDIYSLGSTMFHLLTGADPQSNPLLIFDFQKHPRPRQINPQLSDQMERILMRAVEYNADKRFASAAELRDTLEEHLKNLKANKATYGVRDVPKSVSLSDQPVFCGFCGQKIVATDLFCAFCGAKQPLAQQGVHSQGYAAVPLTAKLLIVGTNELEVPAFRIEKDENLVGRRDPMSNIFPEVDLSKFDPQTKISRKHARIWRQGNAFMVEDLGSSNGTVVLPLVNETVRLQPHRPYTLNNGDKLKLGDTTLHFVIS